MRLRKGRHEKFKGIGHAWSALAVVAVFVAMTVVTASPSEAGADVSSVPVDPDTAGLAINTATNTVYVTDSLSGQVAVLDETTCNAIDQSDCTPVATPTVGGDSTDVAVDSATDSVYWAYPSGGEVLVMNGATCNATNQTNCATVGTATVGTDPEWLAVDPTTDTVYVANFNSGNVSVLDGATCNAADQSNCAPIATVTVGTNPEGVGIDTDTDTIYVSNEGSGTVSVIDGATCDASNQSGCTPVGSVGVGGGPDAVALNSVTDTVYVGNNSSDTVALFNLTTCDATTQIGCGTAPSTVDVGSPPWDLSIDPASNTIYAGDLDDPGTISVFSGSSCDAADTSGCTTAPGTIVLQAAYPHSVAVYPSAPGTPNTVYVGSYSDLDIFGQPGAPSDVTAVGAGSGSVTVSWIVPPSGQLPLSSYTLIPSPPCGSCTGLVAGGSASQATVSGLTNGTSYTFAVLASNAAGTGPVSASSSAVTASEPPSPPPPAPPPSHGYWLVGSDGGIFSFGSAPFYGSTGSLVLQRPVVGIVPTKNDGGYWLDASDGGVFSFGDTQFYGSIPGLGLHPAGSGLPNSLNAPIVGMVPSTDDNGYFMVASDGGVFAFGDAHFAGSCPGIGGCSGSAVAVMPDASGNGYWLVTSTGSVYTFGDASYYGAPENVGSPITSAVRTPNGDGYWILAANGTIYGYGNAGNYGDATGAFGGLNPATAIFTTSDGAGYWISSANGTVDQYGDAPNYGDMAGTHLNGSIVAATGF